jgi:immune inhibitor A
MISKKNLIASVTLALAICLSAVMPALAGPPGGKPARRGSDVVDVGPELRAKDKEYDALLKAKMAEKHITSAQGPVHVAAYTIGTKLNWLAMDEVDPMDKNFAGDIFETEYEVRAITDKCEVWVQTDLNYYNADGTLNKLHRYAKDPLYVTQDRIDYLADLCNDSIRPVDVQYFGGYYERDGTYGYEALINAIYGTTLSEVDGQGDRLVILVSNVRDAQYYDPINNPSAISGFYWGTFNTWGDRNFITLDVREWNRRLGDNPSDLSLAYQYDATLAHELQHLIMADQSPNEDTWINEGMSGFAEFINGYWFTDELGGRQEWQLWPQNALVLWDDQADDNDHYGDEVLADYQLSNAFMLYTAGRIGGDATALSNMGKLTQEPEDGILGFNKWLADTVGSSLTFYDIFKDFRRDMLYGGDTNGAQPQTNWNGNYVDNYVSPLETSGGRATAAAYLGRLRDNLDREGYDTPGVPPFGTNFIELCWQPSLPTIQFDGDESAPGTIWFPVAAADVYPPSGNVAGEVLWSYHNDLEDNFLIYGPLAISAGDQLSFDHFYNIEDTWDYGFVQVTTDLTGMSGWTSLPLAGTKSELDPYAHSVIVANVPGFSGFSDGWLPASYDLGADYAGQTILLAFRYATDWGSAGTDDDYLPGWFIDNVTVGSTTLTDGSSVGGGRSIQEVRSLGSRYDVEFLTWNGVDVSSVHTMTLSSAMTGTLDLAALGDSHFDERGEHGVLMVSQTKPIMSDLINGGMVAAYADYSLTNLPPSLCTSDVQFLGRTHEGRTSVYAGGVVTATTHVDNLGSSSSISTTGPSTVYVGMEVPADTTFRSTGIGTYTADLSSISPQFPAKPGVWWTGSVDLTQDIQATFTADGDLPAGTMLTETVHFASDASATPNQYFSTHEVVKVVSPLSLSTLVADAGSTSPGKVAPFTLQILNLSDATKSVQVTATAPISTTFAGLSTAGEVGASANQIILTQDVPPYATSGATALTYRWLLDSLYTQDAVTSTMTLVDLATGDTLDLSATMGVSTSSVYLPIITK